MCKYCNHFETIIDTEKTRVFINGSRILVQRPDEPLECSEKLHNLLEQAKENNPELDTNPTCYYTEAGYINYCPMCGHSLKPGFFAKLINAIKFAFTNEDE